MSQPDLSHSPFPPAGHGPAWRVAGVYLFFLALPEPISLSIGRLGPCAFPAGLYAYVGSARGPGGLAARLARHLALAKPLHWHIDYLRPAGRPIAIWAQPTRSRLECQWAVRLSQHAAGQRIIPCFGASDCRCAGHLLHWASAVPWPLLQQAIQPTLIWPPAGSEEHT